MNQTLLVFLLALTSVWSAWSLLGWFMTVLAFKSSSFRRKFGVRTNNVKIKWWSITTDVVVASWWIAYFTTIRGHQ